jgi:hypothetical protein
MKLAGRGAGKARNKKKLHSIEKHAANQDTYSLILNDF